MRRLPLAFALAAALAGVAGALYAPQVGIINPGEFSPANSIEIVIWVALGGRGTLVGAALGAVLAHAMFDLPLLQVSAKLRTGTGQWIAEAVATAGLLLVILRAPQARVAAMVAAYIGAAYWFTASTSFANPAAAFGRMFSDSFAGIAPASAPAFMLAEVLGAGLGLLLHRALGRPACA